MPDPGSEGDDAARAESLRPLLLSLRERLTRMSAALPREQSPPPSHTARGPR